MSDISNELSEILTAERGEDVRMSIYRGLEKINNQTISMQTLVDALDEAVAGSAGESVRNLILDTVRTTHEYAIDDSPLTVAANAQTPYYYKVPANLYFEEDNGNYTCVLTFVIDLPKRFAAAYTLTPVTIRLNCENVIVLNNIGVYSPLYNDYIVHNGTVVSGFDSCTLSCLAESNKVKARIAFDDTSAAAMANNLETGNNVCYVTINDFAFTIAEAGE